MDGNLAMANSQQYDSEAEFNEAYKSFVEFKVQQCLSLSFQLEGSVFNYNQNVPCVSVHRWSKTSPDDYDFNYEAYFGSNAQRLHHIVVQLEKQIEIDKQAKQ